MGRAGPSEEASCLPFQDLSSVGEALTHQLTVKNSRSARYFKNLGKCHQGTRVPFCRSLSRRKKRESLKNGYRRELKDVILKVKRDHKAEAGRKEGKGHREGRGGRGEKGGRGGRGEGILSEFHLLKVADSEQGIVGSCAEEL